MLQISPTIAIPDNEIELRGVRAQGPGGQNVNKVSTAVHLRFDILKSFLPQRHKDKLLKLEDNRVTKDGVINIKAQGSRSQERNRESALSRLQKLIQNATRVRKPRKKTRPSRAARERRINDKTKRGSAKILRRRIVTLD